MAKYSYDQRQVMNAEACLWCVTTILSEQIGHAGAWSDRIEKLRAEANKIAAELRDYNDQFEENGA